MTRERAIRAVISVILMIALSVGLIGCAGGKNAGEEKKDSAAGRCIFKDDAEREVEIPETISKVVTLGSTGQIMMLSLAPELLVGINAPIEVNPEEYFDFDYSGLPEIGQYYGQRNLNLEEVAASGTQLIIDLGDTKKNAREDMDKIQEQTGIPTIHINATLETTPDAFRRLGRLLGREERSEELASECEKIREEVAATVENAGEKKTVLLCAGADGLTITPVSSVHSEIIDMVGVNVAETDNNSETTDIEQIAIWNPDAILFLGNSIFEIVDQIPEWAVLPAIEQKAYYEVPGEPYCWAGFPPSANRYLGLLWLTSVLYPEQYTFDMESAVKEYYEIFYGCELEEGDYKRLLRKEG